MRMYSIVLSLLVGLACRSGSDKAPGVVEKSFFYHGDVRALIAGTRQEPESFFKVENFRDFDNYTIAAVTRFVPRTENSDVQRVRDQKSLERQNSTKNRQLSDRRFGYGFSQDGETFIYRPDARFGDTPENLPKLVFKAHQERLDLIQISGMPVSPLHYSVTPDGRAFSMLVTYEYEGDEILLSLTFVRHRSEVQELQPSRGGFAYIMGEDIPLRRRDAIEFSLCGAGAAARTEELSEAIAAWSKHGYQGYIGNLSYSIDVLPEPPPFSDVNVNCFYVIENFRAEAQEGVVVHGAAMHAIDRDGLELLNASVFLFADALGTKPDRWRLTTIHETGHLLGLGHEFTRGLSGELVYDSIMGYVGYPQISERDWQALDALYPEATIAYANLMEQKITVPEGWPVEAVQVERVRHVNFQSMLIQLRNETGSTRCDAVFRVELLDAEANLLYQGDLNLKNSTPALIDSTSSVQCAPAGQPLYLTDLLLSGALPTEKVAEVKIILLQAGNSPDDYQALGDLDFAVEAGGRPDLLLVHVTNNTGQAIELGQTFVLLMLDDTGRAYDYGVLSASTLLSDGMPLAIGEKSTFAVEGPVRKATAYRLILPYTPQVNGTSLFEQAETSD